MEDDGKKSALSCYIQTAAVIVVTKRVVSLRLKFGYYNMLTTCAVIREFKIKLFYHCLKRNFMWAHEQHFVRLVFLLVPQLHITSSDQAEKNLTPERSQSCLPYMPMVYRKLISYHQFVSFFYLIVSYIFNSYLYVILFSFCNVTFSVFGHQLTFNVSTTA